MTDAGVEDLRRGIGVIALETIDAVDEAFMDAMEQFAAACTAAIEVMERAGLSSHHQLGLLQGVITMACFPLDSE